MNDKVNSQASVDFMAPHELSTLKGVIISSDLTFFCTGQRLPNTQFLKVFPPHILNSKNEVIVNKNFQLADPNLTHLFW